MAYKYKLETLLKVRRNFEDLCKEKLAHELHVLENHKQHLEDIEAKRIEIVATLERRKQETLSSAMFTFYVEAIHNKNREIAFQHNAIEIQENAVEEVRVELLEKVKARKVVERLKEKDFLVYTKDMQRKEQNENDEQFILRFGNQR